MSELETLIKLFYQRDQEEIDGLKKVIEDRDKEIKNKNSIIKDQDNKLKAKDLENQKLKQKLAEYELITNANFTK